VPLSESVAPRLAVRQSYGAVIQGPAICAQGISHASCLSSKKSLVRGKRESLAGRNSHANDRGGIIRSRRASIKFTEDSWNDIARRRAFIPPAVSCRIVGSKQKGEDAKYERGSSVPLLHLSQCYWTKRTGRLLTSGAEIRLQIARDGLGPWFMPAQSNAGNRRSTTGPPRKCL